MKRKVITIETIYNEIDEILSIRHIGKNKIK